MIRSIFEHVYLIIGWWLINLIEMNDNGNFLFTNLLLSKYFYISQHGNPLCCRAYNCKAIVASLNIPRSILEI